MGDRHPLGKQILRRMKLMALGVSPKYIPVQPVLASGTWETEAMPRGSWEIGRGS